MLPCLFWSWLAVLGGNQPQIVMLELFQARMVKFLPAGCWLVCKTLIYCRADPGKQTVCLLRSGIKGEEDFIQVGVDPTDAAIGPHDEPDGRVNVEEVRVSQLLKEF